MRDTFLRLQVSNAPEPRVLVVDIDEASLARLGPWPWPRARLADLVEMLLSHYEARGVALDILLPKSSGSSATATGAWPCWRATARWCRPRPSTSTAHLRPNPVRDGRWAAPSSAMPAGVEATGYIGNYPALAQAPHIGAIGFIPGPDGTLRRVPLITRFEGRPIRRWRWPCSTAAAAKARWSAAADSRADAGRLRARLERLHRHQRRRHPRPGDRSGRRRAAPGAGRLVLARHGRPRGHAAGGQPSRPRGAGGDAVHPARPPGRAGAGALAGTPAGLRWTRC
jgi:hypothetical protein